MRDTRKITSLHLDRMDADMIRQTAQWLKATFFDSKEKWNYKQRNQKPYQEAVWNFVINEPMKFLNVLRSGGVQCKLRWYDEVRNAKGEVTSISVEIT